MVKNLSAYQTQAQVHKRKWAGLGNLRYCCELVLPKTTHLLNHKCEQLRCVLITGKKSTPSSTEKRRPQRESNVHEYLWHPRTSTESCRRPFCKTILRKPL